MVTIELGKLKDKAEGLLSLLEKKLGERPLLEGDVIILGKEGDEGGPPREQVKTYLKRFLHKEGVRKDYRISLSKGSFKLVQKEKKK